MSQRTIVLKVPPADQQRLRSRLNSLDLEWRSVPHASFSARGEGAIVTLYKSGKLVVQGANPEAFVLQHTGLDLPAGAVEQSGPAEEVAPEDDPFAHVTGPFVGSDETGKGDYFGPLVVAAVRMESHQAQKLIEWGVADSKKLTDKRALKLAALLRDEVEYTIESLQPPEYNVEYARMRTLNPLLAAQHARAIRALAQPGDAVLVDQFAKASVMEAALEGSDVRLFQAHRGERHVTVAAASILARAEFLLGLAALESQEGLGLHKGAGQPTDDAGLSFARANGMDALVRVAKVHFKNTGKIARRLG
ncbi:MAG: ribonuclease HIII [Planctomycetota bacterium]|nr:ribonuclease HIII [Planctomycetota bacterium]